MKRTIADSKRPESDKLVFWNSERHVQIVGIEQADREGLCVHTIDVWFSRRRESWILERLDRDGHQIGAAHSCRTEAEAADCLAEWLRAHDEVCLIAPREATAAEMRIFSGRPHRRAA